MYPDVFWVVYAVGHVFVMCYFDLFSAVFVTFLLEKTAQASFC